MTMRMRNYLACLTVALLATTAAMGQKQAEEAHDAYQKGFYYNAIELFKKAYTTEKKATEKANLIFMVGECYRKLGDAPQQEVWYEKANKAQYADPVTYLYIGEALKEQGKYAEAILAYQKYQEKNPGDMRAEAGVRECEMAQGWSDDPTRYKVDPEVLLNSQQYDYSPTFCDKRNEGLVFTSTRQAATGVETDMIIGESFSDLFYSTRDKLGKWSEPVKLSPSVNTMANEGPAVFNKERSIMYFTRCPVEKKEVHGCDIWMSKKVGNEYGEATMLALKPDQDKKDTSVVTIGHPAIAPDDSYLVFSSNMKGGMGGKDLYIVKLDQTGMPVGKPGNLGGEVNTSKDDMFPFIRHNGNLYFSSDGYATMGGMDLFMAESSGNMTWGHVENLKAPLNSAGDDFSLIFDGEEDRGFFTTNRAGGKGQDDVWRFFMPDMVFAMQGTVYDKDKQEPVVGVLVEVSGTDGSTFSAITDENGTYEFADNGDSRFINESTTYSIRATKENYLVVKDQITTVGVSESTTFVKEYFMQYAAPGEKSIELPEVQYEFGKYTLTQAGKDSLETLYSTLTDNPTIVIELNAHTDSRGGNAANQTLSDNRAKSCVNYLITKGIAPERMVPKGYGETRLRITDAQIAAMATEQEREAAHQKNRRTEFKVLRWDYVPPGQAAPEN